MRKRWVSVLVGLALGFLAAPALAQEVCVDVQEGPPGQRGDKCGPDTSGTVDSLWMAIEELKSDVMALSDQLEDALVWLEIEEARADSLQQIVSSLAAEEPDPTPELEPEPEPTPAPEPEPEPSDSLTLASAAVVQVDPDTVTVRAEWDGAGAFAVRTCCRTGGGSWSGSPYATPDTTTANVAQLRQPRLTEGAIVRVCIVKLDTGAERCDSFDVPALGTATDTTTVEPEPEPESSPDGLRAFPEAEGWGADALAECRSLPLVVHFVTTSRSLEQILENDIRSDRYDVVIFRTGGVESGFVQPRQVRCVYVAGQTAPGDGYEVRRGSNPVWLMRDGYRDWALRYLTIRGDSASAGRDAFGIVETTNAGSGNIIIDHLGVEGGTDETLSIVATGTGDGGIENVTVQWSIIGPGFRPHSAGSLVGGLGAHATRGFTWANNYWPHAGGRHPLWQEDIFDAQQVGDVVYNWRNYGTGAGKKASTHRERVDISRVCFRAGPWTSTNNRGFVFEDSDDPVLPVLWVNRIQMDSRDGALLDSLGDHRPFFRRDRSTSDGSPLPASVYVSQRQSHPPNPVTERSCAENIALVLAWAGNSRALACDGTWKARRDPMDEKLAQHARDFAGPGSDDANTSWSDYGGLPGKARGTACADSDGDGLPDAWEAIHGDLAPGGDRDGDGYLNVEEYVNGTPP